MNLTFRDMLRDHSDLHQTEQYLSRMGQVLQRLELEPLTQFDTLLTMLRNAAARVKNDESVTGRESQTAQEIALPAGPAMPPDPQKWVYVAQPASEGVTPRAAAGLSNRTVSARTNGGADAGKSENGCSKLTR
ncbi:MAG: hypothetical protein ACRCT4_12605 [Silvania sp.]